jgi:hypothetical protein
MLSDLLSGRIDLREVFHCGSCGRSLEGPEFASFAFALPLVLRFRVL